MEQIPIYFYFISFQMTFLIHEMNIQLFSFDWGELYWGFHNFEPPLTLLNLDFAEPWFKILLTQCLVLVTDFSYNFYINIHEWAWRSSLNSDLSATVTFGVLFHHVLGDSLCVGFLCSLKLFTWETIWAWWLENDAFSTSSLIIGLFRILVSSRVNFGYFYIF